jgi:hypothetical protein
LLGQLVAVVQFFTQSPLKPLGWLVNEVASSASQV